MRRILTTAVLLCGLATPAFAGHGHGGGYPETIPLPNGWQPEGIATDGSVIWVANRSGTVDRINATSAERLKPIDAHGPLGPDIAVTRDFVWVSGTDDVVRIERSKAD